MRKDRKMRTFCEKCGKTTIHLLKDLCIKERRTKKMCCSVCGWILTDGAPVNYGRENFTTTQDDLLSSFL